MQGPKSLRRPEEKARSLEQISMFVFTSCKQKECKIVHATGIMMDHIDTRRRNLVLSPHEVLLITCANGPNVSLRGCLSCLASMHQYCSNESNRTSAGRDVLWDQKSLTSYLQEQKSEEARKEKREDPGLLRRVFDKADAGFDVCLETLDGLA
jgi:hypothetical protein